MVLYKFFYGFKKNQIPAQNPKRIAFGFTENDSLQQKLAETPYFLVIKPIFQIGYT
jgi:hypothetical protein